MRMAFAQASRRAAAVLDVRSALSASPKDGRVARVAFLLVGLQPYAFIRLLKGFLPTQWGQKLPHTMVDQAGTRKRMNSPTTRCALARRSWIKRSCITSHPCVKVPFMVCSRTMEDNSSAHEGTAMAPTRH